MNIKKKRKLLVLAEHNFPEENNYYSRKIIYKRIPDLKNEDRYEKWAFTIDSFSNGFESSDLTSDQKNIANNLYKNMNSHLTSEMRSIINKQHDVHSKYTSYQNWYHSIRRAWSKSNFHGKVNSEKTLRDLLEQLWKKIKKIYYSESSQKEKFKALKELFLYSEEAKLLKTHFQHIYNEVIIEIENFIENTRDKVNEILSPHNYNGIPQNKLFITRAFWIFRKFSKTLLYYKSKNKEFHENAKKGNFNNAQKYIERKYNKRLIPSLERNFDKYKPILLPIVSMPKFIDKPKSFFESLEADPESVLKQNMNSNLIPLALATYISAVTGWPLDFNINTESILKCSHFHSSKRKSKSVIERFFQPGFYSGKPLPDKNYIIVDDNITLGGSVRDLQEFLEQNGANVIGIITLDRSLKTGFNPTLKPTNQEVEKIKRKKWFLEYCFNDILGYEDGIGSLTKQEMAALNSWIFRNPFKKKQIETICLDGLTNMYIVNSEYINIIGNKIIPNLISTTKSFDKVN